jgi:hypothetical protein
LREALEKEQSHQSNYTLSHCSVIYSIDVFVCL